MSKRSLEFEDYVDPKKQKIHETSDYSRCSPLLFFDDHISNQDNENNNVITEIFSDNLNEKNSDNIANGFSHNQSCEKLVDSNHQNVEKCYENEIENVNSEIVEAVDNNGLKVQTIVSNVTELILDTTQVVSNTVETSPHVENSILHNHLSIVGNGDKAANQSDEINNKLPMSELTENHCQESVGVNDTNEERMVIEVTSATVFNSEKDYINEKQDLLILNNSDMLSETILLPIESEKADILIPNNSDPINENKILPIESEDIKKDVKISGIQSKTQNESLKTDYKLRSSSTKLEIPEEVMTPQKDIPIRKSSRISKGKSGPINEKKSPLSEKKTLKNNKTSNYERIAPEEEIIKNEMLSDTDNNETTTVKRRISLRIETLAKNKQVKSVIKKSPRVNSTKNKFDRMRKSFNYNDPGTWPNEVPNDMKIDLIKKGPVQIESKSFPKDDRNRSFSSNHFFINMPNGEKGRRFWLTYSESKDAVYCFACRLFSYDSSTTLANIGSNNWKKLNERLCSHEYSPKHLSSIEQWCQFLVDKEGATCGLDLTNEEALLLAVQLKNFASNKSNKAYLLAKQLESELGSYIEKVEVNTKQD